MARVLSSTIILTSCFMLTHCSTSSHRPPESLASPITYSSIEGGEIWFRHSQIQLRFDSEMYCRIFFRKDHRLLSMNDIPPDPRKAKPTHFIEVNGEEIRDFNVDYRNFGVSDIRTQFGVGKKMQLVGYAKTSNGILIEKKLTVELYQDYPDTAILAASYLNASKASPILLTRTFASFFRLDAARTKPGVPPFSFWIRCGDKAAGDGGVPKLIHSNYSKKAIFENKPINSSSSLPIVDFWNQAMGMGIGNISNPLQANILTVSVAPDQRVETTYVSATSLQLDSNQSLPTDRIFVMVHPGNDRGTDDPWETFLRRYQQLKVGQR